MIFAWKNYHICGNIKSAVITTLPIKIIPYIDVSENNRPIVPITHYLGRTSEGLENAVAHVIENLTPVTVEWGVAEENRITYNRKEVSGRNIFYERG